MARSGVSACSGKPAREHSLAIRSSRATHNTKKLPPPHVRLQGSGDGIVPAHAGALAGPRAASVPMRISAKSRQYRNASRKRTCRGCQPGGVVTHCPANRTGSWNASMKLSTDRILTTHVGSLPRPDDLFELMLARMDGKPVDEKAYAERVRSRGAGQRAPAGRRRARRRQRRRDGQAELHHLRRVAPGRPGEARGQRGRARSPTRARRRFSRILPVRRSPSRSARGAAAR